MRALRITALCPFAFAVIAFAFNLVLLLAGSRPGYLGDDFMISLNTSTLGQNIIRFEPANFSSSVTSSPSPTSSSSPFDFLNPLSTSSPLNPENPNNPLEPLLGPLINNATSTIDDGLQNAVNAIAETLVRQIGVRDFYDLFIQKICEGDVKRSGNGVNITECSGYDDKNAGFNNITKNLQSSIVIGTTNISVPLIASLSSSLSSVSSTTTTLRKVLVGFLVVASIGAGLTFCLGLPAIVFSESRAFIYGLMFSSLLASTFQLLAAILLTGLIVTVAVTVNLLGDAVGLHAQQGTEVLLFVWLSWLFLAFAASYWTLVWFVEVRNWSFARRQRTADEKGNWRGISREVWRDLRGDDTTAKG